MLAVVFFLLLLVFLLLLLISFVCFPLAGAVFIDLVLIDGYRTTLRRSWFVRTGRTYRV